LDLDKNVKEKNWRRGVDDFAGVVNGSNKSRGELWAKVGNGVKG
jgi:hypothetical protein